MSDAWERMWKPPRDNEAGEAARGPSEERFWWGQRRMAFKKDERELRILRPFPLFGHHAIMSALLTSPVTITDSPAHWLYTLPQW